MVQADQPQTEPMAYSLDGRQFSFEAPLSLQLVVGTYVVLKTPEGAEFLGQVEMLDVASRDVEFEHTGETNVVVTAKTQYSDRVKIRHIAGTGVLLGAIEATSFRKTTYKDRFPEVATIELAEPGIVSRYVGTAKSDDLSIGTALYTDGNARVVLLSKGFDSHTFLCGQSGSGKTFSLGIVLEQLLVNTPLRIVVIDPNSDFVNLSKRRTKKDFFGETAPTPAESKQYGDLVKRYKRVLPKLFIVQPGRNKKNPLLVRFSDLEPDHQATVLHMDPLADREEFNAFRRITEEFKKKPYTLSQIMTVLARHLSPEARQLALRINNLGVEDWALWCKLEEQSLGDLLNDDWRCIVVDIGALSPDEKAVVAAFVLDHFWEKREAREPVLLVIDEAHNVCPSEPSNPLEALSTDHAIRIAGEGRKYQLRLLLASQRPSKIHSSVVSQCENVILMRMNSRSDVNHITELFSQVPATLLLRAPAFSQGESLVAGYIAKSPTFVKSGRRLTKEGKKTSRTAAATRKSP
jgi:hypothetical protein